MVNTLPAGQYPELKVNVPLTLSFSFLIKQYIVTSQTPCDFAAALTDFPFVTCLAVLLGQNLGIL